MTDKSVEDVIKQLVLANADNEIQSIAVVMVNVNGEPELHIGLTHENAYKIISGLRIMEHHIIGGIMENAAKPSKDRT